MTGSTALSPATTRWCCLPSKPRRSTAGRSTSARRACRSASVTGSTARLRWPRRACRPCCATSSGCLRRRSRCCGRKFIGLLLFASERDDYRYTLQAGAELLGTVRPARRDNRRHLIVAERPIEILGWRAVHGPRGGRRPLLPGEGPVSQRAARGIVVRAAPGPAEHAGDRRRNGRAARHRFRAGDGDRDGDSARGCRRPGDRHERRLLPSLGAPVAGAAARDSRTASR